MPTEPADRRTPARRHSILWVLAATVVTGIAGYLVMWLVARVLGAADYVVFGVFWSGLFLVVGILFGLQQESTRATAAALLRPAAEPARSSLWVFGAAAGVVAGVVVLASSVWWAPAALGAAHSGLALQIALGSALNAVVATLSGAFAGALRWRFLAAVIGLDGLLRLAGVATVLAFTTDPAWIAWAVVIPFPLSIGIVFLSAPRLMLGLGVSPLSYRELAANSGHTLLAASATAILINGFPLVLALFAHSGEAATLGALIFAITLTRAPILVPMMALQSYLVTRFTNNPGQIWKLIGQAFALIGAVMIVLAVVTALWGSWALATFVRPDFALSAAALVPLVVSSGFIGALCVTGPALLARGKHRAYALGWLTASVVALAVLFLSLGVDTRAALALSVGPIAGLLVHLGVLAGVLARSGHVDARAARE